MSYYGDGRVSSDFVGLARPAPRRRRARHAPRLLHRVVGQRHGGKVQRRQPRQPRRPGPAGSTTRCARPTTTPSLVPGRSIRPGGPAEPFRFAPREDLDLDKLRAIVADPKQTVVNRNRSALTCGWMTPRRVAAAHPAVDPDARGQHAAPPPRRDVRRIPARRPQRQRSGSMLATAAYGDGGPLVHPAGALLRRGRLRALGCLRGGHPANRPTARPIADLLRKTT